MASRKFSHLPKVLYATWNAAIIIKASFIFANDNLLSFETSTRPSPLLLHELDPAHGVYLLAWI